MAVWVRVASVDMRVWACRQPVELALRERVCVNKRPQAIAELVNVLVRHGAMSLNLAVPLMNGCGS